MSSLMAKAEEIVNPPGGVREAAQAVHIAAHHIREGRFQRSLALTAGLSSAIAGLEVAYEHYRGSYGQRDHVYACGMQRRSFASPASPPPSVGKPLALCFPQSQQSPLPIAWSDSSSMFAVFNENQVDGGFPSSIS